MLISAKIILNTYHFQSRKQTSKNVNSACSRYPQFLKSKQMRKGYTLRKQIRNQQKSEFCFMQLYNKSVGRIGMIYYEQSSQQVQKQPIKKTFVQSFFNPIRDLKEIKKQLNSITLSRFMKKEKQYSKIIQKFYDAWGNSSEKVHEKVYEVINSLNSLIMTFSDIYNFPYFKHVIKEYSNYGKKQPQPIEDKASLKRRDVEYDQRVRSNMLNLQKTNILVQACHTDEVILPNPEYACCATSFYEGWSIKKNEEHRNFILTTKQKLLQKFEMQNMICALLNSRLGGYILVGVQDDFIVHGDIVTDKQSKIIDENYKEAKKFILPIKYSYNICLEYVPVKLNPLRNGEQDLKSRFVIRIKVSPNKIKQTYYVHGQRNGYHSLYKCYILNDKYSYEAIADINIYDAIVNKFKRRKKNTNFHNFEGCKVPQRGYFKEVKKYKQKNNQSQVPSESQFLHTKYKPNFRFRYQSILISTEKKSHLIDEMAQELRLIKCKFLLQKPFPEFRKNSGRQIWLLSHEDKFVHINETKKKIDKGESITFFSININLQINENFNNKNSGPRQQKINLLKINFENHFQKSLLIQQVDSETRVLKFDYFQQSLYAFVFLQNCALRTMFIKDKDKENLEEDYF